MEIASKLFKQTIYFQENEKARLFCLSSTNTNKLEAQIGASCLQKEIHKSLLDHRNPCFLLFQVVPVACPILVAVTSTNSLLRCYCRWLTTPRKGKAPRSRRDGPNSAPLSTAECRVVVIDEALFSLVSSNPNSAFLRSVLYW